MFNFVEAKPIWIKKTNSKSNQFVGFKTNLQVESKEEVTIAIAARSYYRLFVNGEIIAYGPARTAKGYCRVDEIKCKVKENVKIAIEVLSLYKPNNYSNDVTLEEGLFIAEIYNSSGEVINSTNHDDWETMQLKYRITQAELMSHSRGIAEVYDLNTTSYNWIIEDVEMENPIELKEKVSFLKRRANYPNYKKIKLDTILNISSLNKLPELKNSFTLKLAESFNSKWYKDLKDEDRIARQLLSEQEKAFEGSCSIISVDGHKQITLDNKEEGNNISSITWAIDQSEVGFVQIEVYVKNDTILDLVHCDHLSQKGEVKGNSYYTRYKLKSGKYKLTTFEPKLVKYLKIIIRTSSKVVINEPAIINYTYPDNNKNSFECNDGELNMIYQGAKRTLRMNTLDIFMDCPQRERGGWLCDSYFTSKAAWQMYSDSSVEKDFLENFLLTDKLAYKHGFFPDVYPGRKEDETDPGIMNWSFWLLLEIEDYYHRTADTEFIETHKDRITFFVNELIKLRDESGLIPLETKFVDWSLSNKDFCTEPYSIPINCLIVYMLRKMAVLYGNDDWNNTANEIEQILDNIKPNFLGYADAVSYENDKYKIGKCLTETGVALQLWSGFKLDNKKFIKNFLEKMGTAPVGKANPNVGRANLFIGLLIRFDVLAKLNKIEKLVDELKNVYLNQYTNGPGTFFENISDDTGNHGFNSYAGTLLVNKILGLGQINEKEKKIIINPNILNLKWAQGLEKCSDGSIFLKWEADHEEHILKINLVLPKGWEAEIRRPFSLSGWKVFLNNQEYKE